MTKKILHNVMEDIVSTLVTILFNGPEYHAFCKCEKCRTDVIALSLNSLPAHYVTTEEGRQELINRLNTPEQRQWINKRIIRAIHLVDKYPKHEQT